MAIRVKSLVTVLAVAGCSAQPAQPPRAIIAQVVDIAPTIGKFNTDQVMVTARAPDGRIGTKYVLAAHLKCRVGDQIRATTWDLTLKMDSEACVG